MITEDVDSFGIPLSEGDDEFASLEKSLSKLSSIFEKEIRSKISKLHKYANEDVQKLINTLYDFEAGLVSAKDTVFIIKQQRE